MMKSISESNIEDYMEGLACVHAVGGYPKQVKGFSKEKMQKNTGVKLAHSKGW